MTKTEYLNQLNYKLRVLPDSERHDALEYYDGYISDAENETAAIAQLGTPGEVAANILANYVAKRPDPHGVSPVIKSRTSGVKMAWMIILALFALPIGVPLIIALAATAFSLFMALFAVVLGVGVSGIALVVSGIVGIISFPFLIMHDMGFAMVYGGSGLILLGLGILFVKYTAVLMMGFPMIARFVGRIVIRRNHHGR